MKKLSCIWCNLIRTAVPARDECAPAARPGELQWEQRDRISMNHLIMVPRCTSHKIMFNRARTREHPGKGEITIIRSAPRNCRSAARRNWRDVARRINTHDKPKTAVIRGVIYALACVRTFQRQRDPHYPSFFVPFLLRYQTTTNKQTPTRANSRPLKWVLAAHKELSDGYIY